MIVSLLIFVLGGVSLANKEVYRLSIKVGVEGSQKAKKEISNLESATEKAEKKMKKLDRTNISPTAKLNDKASSTIDKLQNKANKFKSAKMTATASIKDNATSGLDKIQNKVEKLDKTETKVKIKAEDQASSVINKAQTKLSGWIKAGAKKIISLGVAGSLALGGVGIGSAMKTFTDFESAMSTVQATSMASAEDLTLLTEKAKEMGAKSVFSATESAEALNYMAMAGWKTDQMLGGIEGIMNLAAASGEDLAMTSDIVTDALTAFGMQASDSGKFADILAAASSNANTNVHLLGESFKYVAATAGAMKYNAEDTSIALGLMANAGIKGSMGGTALKNAIVNMVSPTDTMATVMDKYNLSLTDSEGNMKSLKSVIDMLRENMGGLDEATQAAAASQLFGKEAMSGMLSIINASQADYDKLTDAIYNSSGAADKMSATRLDNLKGQIEELSGAVETMKINLGERLAPYAKQFVSWLTNKIPVIEDKIVSVVDYISKHTGQIKAMAVSIAAIGTAFAGLSAVSKVSGMINGLKSLGGLLGLGSTAASAAGIGEGATVAAAGLGKFAIGAKAAALGSKALTFMTGPAGLAIAAVATTAVIAAHELKKEVVPAVDLFADGTELSLNKVTNTLESTTIKISDSTKKNVGYYMEMDNKISKTLNKMKFTHQVMSEGIADYFINNISQMSSKVTAKLEETKSNSDKILQDMFANSNLSSEQQGTITVAVDTVYSNQQQTNENAASRMTEIYNNAKGRELTQAEYSEITELQNQMRDNAITALSETEKEAAIIRGRIKDNSTRMTAETASEIVQELEKQRQDTVDKANAEYAERINLAEQIKNSGVEGASEAATQIIAEAERQRDQTIQAATDTKQQGIDMLKQAYSELESNVDTNTGLILDFWGRLKKWWGSNNFETKTANVIVNNPTASGTSGAIHTTAGTVESFTPKKTVKSYNMYPAANKNLSSGGYASGTDSATAGIHEVAEHGVELVVGRQTRKFKGGEQVLNNGETKSFFKGLGQTQVFQPQPQVQVVGNGGNNFGDINLNVNNGQNPEQLIEQACQEFARQLREALFNTN